jgi:hypothetical protein
VAHSRDDTCVCMFCKTNPRFATPGPYPSPLPLPHSFSLFSRRRRCYCLPLAYRRTHLPSRHHRSSTNVSKATAYSSSIRRDRGAVSFARARATGSTVAPVQSGRNPRWCLGPRRTGTGDGGCDPRLIGHVGRDPPFSQWW